MNCQGLCDAHSTANTKYLRTGRVTCKTAGQEKLKILPLQERDLRLMHMFRSIWNGIILFLACQSFEAQGAELGSPKFSLRSLSSCSKPMLIPTSFLNSNSDENINFNRWQATTGLYHPLTARLRGGKPAKDFFKGSKESDTQEEDEVASATKQVDRIPIKWVIAGTVGGLCLLSGQIAHILILGYGFCYPAFCRFHLTVSHWFEIH